MQCKGCGVELQAGVRYCPYCGKEQPQESSGGKGTQHIHIHTHVDGAQYQQPQVNVNYNNQQPQYQPVQYQQPVQYVQQPQVQVQYQTQYQPVQYVQPVQQVSNKSRTVALLLEFFLGFLGIHRFYMGHAGLGVLYLLTGGVCGIGCLVDFFILLLGTPRDSFGREMKW